MKMRHYDVWLKGGYGVVTIKARNPEDAVEVAHKFVECCRPDYWKSRSPSAFALPNADTLVEEASSGSVRSALMEFCKLYPQYQR